MQISPIKSTLKPPRIEPNKIGLRASSSSKVSGNSIQLIGTTPGTLPVMEIWGETVGKKAVFGTATVTVTGVASLPFTGGASLTFSGFATTANNKTVTLTSINGLVMTFPAATFTAATELQGTISDGTNTVNIAVSPADPQTLTSLLNFDLLHSDKNLIRRTASYPITSSGITATYDSNTDTYTLNGTSSGSFSKDIYRDLSKPVRFGNGVVSTLSTRVVSGSYSGGVVQVVGYYRINGGTEQVRFATLTGGATSANSTITSAGDMTAYAVGFYIPPGVTVTNLVLKIQLEVGALSEWKMPSTDGLWTSIPLKDTANNQLENRGIPATYNADGSVATWAAQDKVIKKTDGKWYLRQYVKPYTIQASDLTSLDTGATNIDRCLTSTTIFPDAYKEDWVFSVKTTSTIMNKYTARAFVDNLANVNTFYGSNKNRLVFCFAKGKYANLAAAQADLAGTLIYCTLVTPADTELSTADQTALNSIAKTFAGTTNIMLSTDIGQVYVELSQWSDSAKR
jgi:hypothetical protein